MKIDEMIDVLMQAKLGKKIESRRIVDSEFLKEDWELTNCPVWNFGTWEYRPAVEKRGIAGNLVKWLTNSESMYANVGGDTFEIRKVSTTSNKTCPLCTKEKLCEKHEKFIDDLNKKMAPPFKKRLITPKELPSIFLSKSRDNGYINSHNASMLQSSHIQQMHEKGCKWAKLEDQSRNEVWRSFEVEDWK